MALALTAPRLSRRPSAVLVAVSAVLLGLILGALIVLATPLYAVGALLGLAGLAALLASVRLAWLALVGVVTLLPFFVIPVPIGGVRLTLLDATLTLLLLAWLGGLLSRSADRVRGSGVEPAMVVFLGLALTSFLIGLGHSASPEGIRLFLKWVNSTLLFFTVVNLVRSGAGAVLLVRALLVGAAVAGCIGIFLYVAPRDIALQLLSPLRYFGYPPAHEMFRTIADTSILRAVGTSIDPNVFGAMLAVVGAIAVSQAVARRPVFPRWQLVALAAPIGLALLLTYSRGSWVGLGAALALLTLLRRDRVWRGAMLVGVTLVIAIALGALPAENRFLSHFESGLAVRDKATGMRLGEYKDALILISRYPIFGVGFGSAPDVDIYVGVSSIYLLIAEHMGLLGLAAYLVTLAWLFVRAFTALRRLGHSPHADLLLSVTIALVAALAAGVFDHHFANLRFPHMVALFWLIAGLIATLTRVVEESAEPTPPGSAPPGQATP